MVRSNNDPCLYIKFNENREVYLLLYLDDIIIASNSNSIEEIEYLKYTLVESFNMKDMEDLKHFLDIKIRTEKGIYLSQTNYLHRVLERLRMQECKGCMLLSENLGAAVNFRSRYQNNPNVALWQTVNYELFFENDCDDKLIGFCRFRLDWR